MAREEDAEEGELGEIVPAPRRAAGGGHERGRGRSRSPSRDERKRKRPSSRDARRDDSRRGDDGRDGAGRDRDRRGWGADRDRDREWDRGKRRDWGDRPEGHHRDDREREREREDPSRRARLDRAERDSASLTNAPAKVDEEDAREEEDLEAYRARVAAAFEEEEEGEEAREARLAEERRRRREEIVAKHRAAAKEKEKEKQRDAARPTETTTGRGGADVADEKDEAAAPRAPEPSTRSSAPPAAPGTRAPASDMFADDADIPVLGEKTHETNVTASAGATADAAAADMTAGLSDNWDDADGYYRARVGEVLDGRYKVLESGAGRGVFSTVVRAIDLEAEAGHAHERVAIKVIRANETMRKAAQLEMTVLRKLTAADPEDARHCVRFLRHFEYRKHAFMVFESMHMNLREVLKKYGRDVGINVHGVRSFATQMLSALRHMKNCGVVHADIKPDNVLVNATHDVLKVCDFGSAMFDGDNELTPYLQSRFYRAPEVILGLAYSHPMDLWSVGCCLYELYTGRVAFQGRSNNEMMKLFIETKGPVPRKMLRKAAFRENHYDDEGVFSLVEEDPVTKRQIRRLVRDARPTKDVAAKLLAHDRNLGERERKMVAQLGDLLDKMFTFEPEKRITVAQALAHPFITG